jgi:hypothetical protein
VTLPGCTGADGTLRWYGGGRLADSLTLPRLRAAWNQSHGAAAEHSGAYGFTEAERTEIYRHATRRTAATTEHLRWCTVHDAGRGADAAWAAADTLHAAARATGSPVLRCAADKYDRAARAPYGRIPQRTGDGEWLRATARLIAMADRTPGDATMLAGALVANLVALADAVAGSGRPRRMPRRRPPPAKPPSRCARPSTAPGARHLSRLSLTAGRLRPLAPRRPTSPCRSRRSSAWALPRVQTTFSPERADRSRPLARGLAADVAFKGG